MLYTNKRTLLWLFVALSFSTIFLVSCDKGEISEDEYQSQKLREAQLLNTFDNEILKLNIAFVSETTALNKVVENFEAQPTIQNLELARSQWVEMLKVWKQLEMYNVGEIEDSFIHFEINRWPANTELIDGIIEGTETIDEGFIASHGSSSKGISAMEFLLFSSGDEQEVLSGFTTGINSDRRLDYLVALSENLQTKAEELASMWQVYKSAFISSLGSGIGGSQNQLANAMVTLLEEIIISKLGNVLGDNSGGMINAELLEAYRSENSLTIIQEHLTALDRCYTGSFNQNTIQWGFDSYLRMLGKNELDEEIRNGFSNCREKLNAITSSLKQELTTNPQNVAALKSAFSDLLVLIKVDMSNAIGTTITINDNDGD